VRRRLALVALLILGALALSACSYPVTVWERYPTERREIPTETP
jgi:hypothetical protein